jgi:hypothetical protein
MNLNSLYIGIIVLIIFILLNIYLKKNIENYGVPCGRYNINKATAEKNCRADTECQWNTFNQVTGDVTKWCSPNSYNAYNIEKSNNTSIWNYLKNFSLNDVMRNTYVSSYNTLSTKYHHLLGEEADIIY